MALFTKAHYIGEALLRIGGGVVTPDLSVRWGEASVYFAMSVNYVMTGNYWLETKAEQEKTINPLLLVAFNDVPVQYSTDTLRKYIDLTADVITLSKGRAFTMTTMSGNQCFPLVESDVALEEYYGKYKTKISYQLEGLRRVWLWNVPPLVTTLRPKYMVRVNDLDDDAEILIPSDSEVKVLDLMVAFLTGEKQEEKDYAEDGKSK